MAGTGWYFWEVTDGDGALAALCITRPKARSAIDRAKVWSLVPRTRVFVADWELSEAIAEEDGPWRFEQIYSDEARALVGKTPDPSAERLERITHPQRVFTLDQMDSHSVKAVLGITADLTLRQR